MRIFSIIFISALSLVLFATLSIAKGEDKNIFKADLSNPDLEIAVTSFEQVCMPFVLHKTELTREQDKAHHKNLLEDQGYNFQSHERIEKTYLFSKREGNPPIYIGILANEQRHEGWYSLHQERSNEIAYMPKKVIDARTGELHFEHRNIESEAEVYTQRSDDRLSAQLDWNFLPQSQAGESCWIRLKKPKINEEEFITSFIEKDSDWQKKNRIWSQCVKDEDGEYLFSVEYHPKYLSLRLKRRVFIESANLCAQ